MGARGPEFKPDHCTESARLKAGRRAEASQIRGYRPHPPISLLGAESSQQLRQASFS